MAKVTRMTAASGQGAEMKHFDDVIFPKSDALDPERGIRYAREFKYKDGDVVLCTYPKVGTHWMGNIVKTMKTLNMSEKNANTSVEFGPPELIEAQDEPRLIFTHFKPRHLHVDNIETNGKVVLLLRNPKDVAVSFYYHLKNGVLFQNKQTWDEFFQSFITGEIHMGSYFDYLSDWENVFADITSGKSKLRLEVFYYEDMQVDLKANVDRLNKFLGWERDDEYLDKVLQSSSFETMSTGIGENNPIHVATQDQEGKSIIFRKGKVGDWKTHMTVAQSEIIDALMEKTLKRNFLKFKYEL